MTDPVFEIITLGTRRSRFAYDYRRTVNYLKALGTHYLFYCSGPAAERKGR